MASDILLLPAPKKVNKHRLYQGNDPFKVLGVSIHASRKQIDRAYRQLVREYHPDVNPSPDAYEQFKRINDAYVFITRNPDLARLRFKCEVAEYKKEYADFLFAIKRLKLLTGLDQQFPMGKPLGTEIDKRSAKLFPCLMFTCPRCRWQQECDRITGFEAVKDIHYELIRRMASQMMKG